MNRQLYRIRKSNTSEGSDEEHILDVLFLVTGEKVMQLGSGVVLQEYRVAISSVDPEQNSLSHSVLCHICSCCVVNSIFIKQCRGRGCSVNGFYMEGCCLIETTRAKRVCSCSQSLSLHFVSVKGWFVFCLCEGMEESLAFGSSKVNC